METPSEPIVYVIDDDPAMLDSLACLMQSVAIPVQTFAAPDEFFASRDPARAGCLVLDLRMPYESGLEVQERLLATEQPIPVIFVSGHADIPAAVRAMKRGAVEFLTKPFSEEALLSAVRRALQRDREQRRERRDLGYVRARLDSLTAREGQVLEFLVAGASNKETARALSISPKTVELHRANVMRKMAAGSLADLVKMYVRSQGGEAGGTRPAAP